MKVLLTKQRTLLTKSIICILSAFSFIFWISPCDAQKAWSESHVKANKAHYECYLRENGVVYMQNNKFKDPIKSQRQYNPDKDEFSNIRLTSHNALLNAFKESFKYDRISALAKANESIIIFLTLDEKAQILSIRFALNESTTILPIEVEVLEKEVQCQLKFDVIGKHFSEPIFYDILFGVYFTEVEKGEIRMEHVRENVKISQ